MISSMKTGFIAVLSAQKLVQGCFEKCYQQETRLSFRIRVYNKILRERERERRESQNC